MASLTQETNRKPEPLLQGDNTRFTQLPYKYPDLQKAYKNHMSMFWTEDEIDYAADCEDFDNLNPEAKMFIEHVLAFFAGADGIVLENLMYLLAKNVILLLRPLILHNNFYSSNFNFLLAVLFLHLAEINKFYLNLFQHIHNVLHVYFLF